MRADHPSTAKGDLGRTPLGHLLVYALDRRLSGALFFREPSGIEHVVQLSRGAPIKMRPGDAYARLGEMLVERGALSLATVEAALATKGLLGDVLVVAGRVDRDVLERVADEQFVRRIVRLFSLPKETAFRYCDGHEALLDYGGEPSLLDPLSLLWAGMRAHGDASTMLEGTLALLGDAAMRLHPRATAGRFGLTEAEAKVIEELYAGPTPLSRLLARAFVPEQTLRRLCYTLLITRQIELGTGTLPVGAHDVARTPPAGTALVAKMQLRPTVHRVGAAAPDPPGGGERAVNVPVRAPISSSFVAPEEPSAPSVEDPLATLKSAATLPFTALRIEEDAAAPWIAGAGAGEPGEPGEGQRPASVEGGSVASEIRPAMALRVRGHASPAPRASAQVTVLSAPELFQLAVARFEERDLPGALEACTTARKAAPGEPDYVAFSVWIRYQMPGADIKALAVELDEVVAANEAHIQGRFYRALLRRRLGDDLGAIRDLRRVIELFPAHPEAARELAILDAQRTKERAGLFGRLFKR